MSISSVKTSTAPHEAGGKQPHPAPGGSSAPPPPDDTSIPDPLDIQDGDDDKGAN
ncbi:hypothetical protein [Collimonas humicola]|uniref:hypothetical protein n=1 Tax=Collimonas humicola TaxID=2825886 RepID=UPI001B8CA499|nr:hypothetical protein [Collimonas humicola]